jgi:hypothetical protein
MVGGPPSGDACDTNRDDDDTGKGFFAARSVAMSSDARYFAYVFGGGDVLISDRQTHVTRQLPVAADRDTRVAISTDGRYVAIAGFVDALGNPSDAVLVSDWQNGQLWTVVPSSPTGSSYGGAGMAFSSDNELVFSTENPNLVPGDTNGVSDVFVAHLDNSLAPGPS